jgi:uncharacterized protein YfcZ (UPF0381/DUF406 family)
VKKLYIIGNGFDLHHNLKTSYDYFHSFLKTMNPDLIEFLERYFQFNVDDNYLWSKFEEDLGTFNSNELWEDYSPKFDADDDLQYSSFFGTEDEINEILERTLDSLRSVFSDWIESIEIKSDIKIEVDKKAFYLTFNYTHLLENHYYIPNQNILHIHGELNKNELIFGHNIEPEIKSEIDDNGDSNRTMIIDSQATAKSMLYNLLKPVGKLIKKNYLVFQSLKSIETVYVLGHSLNEIDHPYFSEIIKNKNIKEWIVSYHEEEEENLFKSILGKLGVDLNKIKMIRL